MHISLVFPIGNSERQCRLRCSASSQTRLSGTAPFHYVVFQEYVLPFLQREMEYRKMSAIAVKFITTDDMKSICPIKPQSLRVLLIYID